MNLSPSGRVDRERVIGKNTYRVVPLRGEDMIDVLVLILRTLAPIASEEVLAAALSGEKAAGQAAAGNLGSALPDVLRSLDRDTVQELRKRLAEVTEVSTDGGRTWLPLSNVFGEHFAGDVSGLLQWMLHAFGVSFPVFSPASAP